MQLSLDVSTIEDLRRYLEIILNQNNPAMQNFTNLNILFKPVSLPTDRHLSQMKEYAFLWFL